jgi:hypothetical protein
MLAILSETTRRPVWAAIIPEVATFKMVFNDMVYSPACSANHERHDATLPGENCRALRGSTPAAMCKPLKIMAIRS